MTQQPEITPDIHAAARRAAERIAATLSYQHCCPDEAWLVSVMEEELAQVLVNRVAFCPTQASGLVVQGYANRAGSTTGEPHAAD